MTFSTKDLQKLDSIWPIGRELVVPDDGVIFVAGAFEGLYCRYLGERFTNSRIYGFEPQREAWDYALRNVRPCEQCSETGWDYEHVEIFPFGIGLQGSVSTMFDAGTDGCSLLKRDGDETQALLIESRAIRSWLGVDRVALAVINVEGYEYPLLNDWLKHGEISHYDSIAIQFHPVLAGLPENADTDPLVKGLFEHYGQPKYFEYPTWSYFRK